MKKVMWMVLAGLAGLFLTTGSVQAHCGKCGMGEGPKAGKQESAAEHVKKMAKEFKLTPEQKVQVEAIVKEKWEKKQQIMDQKEAAMNALKEETRAKLKGVLNEEQMKKWEAKQQSKCSHCKEGKPCKKCKGEMKGKCPDCKDGKSCKKCKLKMKGKKAEAGGHHGHSHK